MHREGYRVQSGGKYGNSIRGIGGKKDQGRETSMIVKISTRNRSSQICFPLTCAMRRSAESVYVISGGMVLPATCSRADM